MLPLFSLSLRFGIFPITAFALSQPPPQKTRAVTPEGPSVGATAEKKGAASASDASRAGQDGKEKADEKEVGETRRLTHAMVSVADPVFPGAPVFLIMIVRFEDCQNRQLHSTVRLDEDRPSDICEELVKECLISRVSPVHCMPRSEAKPGSYDEKKITPS